MWVIGSKAVAEHMKVRRPIGDIDLMATLDELEQLKQKAQVATESQSWPGKWKLQINGKSVEVDATQNASRLMMTNPENREDFYSHTIDLGFGWADVPKLSTLYCFKRSHAGYPLYPEKTLADLIHISKVVIGTEMKETVRDQFLNGAEILLLNELRAEVKERFFIRDMAINFNKDAKEFFKPAQGCRTYDHDALHDATCRWEAPLYRENLKDPTKALVDMKVFNAHSLEYRLTMAQEEAVVIGVERFYMCDRTMPADVAYRKGMSKLIVDLSKGQFQDFLLDHLHLMTKPLWNFMAKFEAAEASGALTLLEPTV
jgi:hypothetical protein